jgi:hypothetical protein
MQFGGIGISQLAFAGCCGWLYFARACQWLLVRRENVISVLPG